jgi:hypothetical protein
MIGESGPMPQSPTPPFGPLDLEPIYDAVDLAYQAVERPERLPSALGALARLAGAGHVLLIASQAASHRRLVAEGRSEAHAGSSRLESTASGGFRFADATRTVPLGGGYELVLDVEQLSPAALAALLRVTPHLSRALRLADRVESRPAPTAAFEPTLDRLALGVALLDGEGQLLTLNRPARALVSSSSLVGVARGRIEPTQAVPRTLFETLVERVLTPPAPQRRFTGGRVDLHAPGRAAVQLIVAPFRGHLERGEVECAVLISSPGAVPGPEEIFREAHGLSAEEARVATHLVSGRDPVAALPELHPDLVRKVQEKVFRKLGTTRQLDLVRLLLRPPGVLFDAPPEEAG